MCVRHVGATRWLLPWILLAALLSHSHSCPEWICALLVPLWLMCWPRVTRRAWQIAQVASCGILLCVTLWWIHGSGRLYHEYLTSAEMGKQQIREGSEEACDRAPLFLVLHDSEHRRELVACHFRAWEWNGRRWVSPQGLLRLWLDPWEVSEDRVPRYGRLYAWSSPDHEWMRPPGRRNPGGVDYATLLAAHGIAGTLPGEALHEFVDCGRVADQRGWLRWKLSDLRQHLAQRLYHRVGDTETAGMLCAMLLGMRGGLRASAQDALRESGLAHLLAVSGLHVGMLALLVVAAISLLPISLQARRWTCLLLLACYVPLAGAQSSVQRAVCMAVLLNAGAAMGRPQTAMQSLWITASLALALEPECLFDVGFQLSWLAVYSLLRWAGSWQEFLQTRLPLAWQSRTRWITGSLSASMSVSAGTAPLVLATFGRLPLAGMWLNLVAIPIAGVLLMCALLLLLLPLPGEPLAAVAEMLYHALVALADAGPQPVLVWSPNAWQVGILALVLLVPGRPYWCTRVSLSAVLLLLCTDLLPRLFESTGLECLMLDVGQGDAILLRDPSQGWWLVDCGWAAAPGISNGRNAARDVIVPVLQSLGVHHLRGVVLTHPDQDHIGGADYLLKHVQVDTLYHSGRWRNGVTQRLLRSQIALHGPPQRRLQAGDYLWQRGDSQAAVLWPAGPDWPEDPNEASIVIHASCGARSVLLTGDVGHPAEAALSTWGHWLEADVLKLGHHGSAHSSSPSFLRQVSAQWGLISCGRGNRYGHPADRVIASCDTLGMQLWRSDQQGACWLRNAADGWYTVNWHHQSPWTRPEVKREF